MILLNTIHRFFENTTVDNRVTFVSLVRESETLGSLRASGWNISPKLWAKAKVFAASDEIGKPIFHKGGRPSKITPDLLRYIKDFLKRSDITRYSPNRYYKNKKVRYFEKSIESTFQCFLEDLSEEEYRISETLFRTILKKKFPHIKKAKKRTDLCPICETREKFKKLYETTVQFVHRDCGHETVDANSVLSRCHHEIAASPETKKSLDDLRKILETTSRHHRDKNLQRECFNNILGLVDRTSAVLVMDFKENIQLNTGPNEIDREFYNRPQRSCWGAALCFFNTETNQRETVYFDIFSKCLSHSAFFSIEALKHIFSLPDFQRLGIRKLSIWSDNAKHFKAKELFHFYSTLVRGHTKIFDCLYINFFGEYHGKNLCDARFSKISHFLHEASKNEWIRSLDDVVRVIETKQHLRNQVRVSEGKDPIRTHQAILDIPTRPNTYYKLNFRTLLP
eukprot:TRINITY_DN517_c0_g1_i5.p1 TRINITY_DN517_c0_g1~~TRINITY_DN517_c0_g1_i5.p1  ORF type:complete len:452 (-),score=42.56 TRINITY_DN517_c0_g1_i5:756-2111(-)